MLLISASYGKQFSVIISVPLQAQVAVSVSPCPRVFSAVQQQTQPGIVSGADNPGATLHQQEMALGRQGPAIQGVTTADKLRLSPSGDMQRNCRKGPQNCPGREQGGCTLMESCHQLSMPE